jgi:predicted enzyme related to lactoylglutathione lyase
VGQASIGAWQPGRHRGFGILAEPGTAAWFELDTRQYDASVAFYRDVFGWDTHAMSDSADLRYTTLGEGDAALAGIMDATESLPAGASAYWALYFGVADADAALARIADLGGTVVQPAEDTPYGRLAEAADPTGARFRLVAG